MPAPYCLGWPSRSYPVPRSERHTSELQSHRDLHSFPTRRSSDLSQGVGWGSDALQLVGRAHHAGAVLPGLAAKELPSTRLQHEHTLALLQARPMQLAIGQTVTTGFFGAYQPDHPAATSGHDGA